MSDNAPAKFRRKSEVVEAMQWNPADMMATGLLVGYLMAAGTDFDHPSGTGETTTLAIHEDGRLSFIAQPGDWIVRGADGRYDLCPASVFPRTYEPAGVTA